MPEEEKKPEQPTDISLARYIQYKRVQQNKNQVHLSKSEWAKRIKAGESVEGEKYEIE